MYLILLWATAVHCEVYDHEEKLLVSLSQIYQDLSTELQPKSTKIKKIKQPYIAHPHKHRSTNMHILLTES